MAATAEVSASPAPAPAPLALTPRAWSCWARWLTADPGARRAMIDAGFLHPREALALERLEGNLAGLGLPTFPLRPPAAHAWMEAALSGLEARVPLTRVAGGIPGLTELQRLLLADAVEGGRAWRNAPLAAGGAEKRFGVGVVSAQLEEAARRLEAPAPTTREDPQLADCGRERLAAAIDRRQIDLARPVATSLKAELAAEAAMREESVGPALAALRKERGIPTPTEKWARSRGGGNGTGSEKPVEKLTKPPAAEESGVGIQTRPAPEGFNPLDPVPVEDLQRAGVVMPPEPPRFRRGCAACDASADFAFDSEAIRAGWRSDGRFWRCPKHPHDGPACEECGLPFDVHDVLQGQCPRCRGKMRPEPTQAAPAAVEAAPALEEAPENQVAAAEPKGARAYLFRADISWSGPPPIVDDQQLALEVAAGDGTRLRTLPVARRAKVVALASRVLAVVQEGS